MKQGWEIKKLGEVCEIINGFAFKSQLFKDCGDDILRISNIQNGVIDDSDIAHFSKNDYPKVDFDKYTVFPNDIIVALSGATTGKFGINNTGRKLYLNQRVAICREKTNDVHHRFLLYFLKTQSKSFLESAAGVAQPNLSTEQMKLYEIPIPPLAEQEKIVAELDCLSGIIEKKKQQLKEYDALAQSIFYEMFGNPIDNEKGWEVKKFKNCYKLTSGKNLTAKKIVAGDFPVYGGNGIVGYHNDYNLDGDNIIIGRVGALCGNVRNISGKAYITDNAFILTKLEEGINIFILYLLKIHDLRQYARDALQPVISNAGFQNIEIILPPLSLQQQFASKIEAIEKQKELLKQSIAETETLFNSRMDYYFN